MGVLSVVKLVRTIRWLCTDVPVMTLFLSKTSNITNTHEFGNFYIFHSFVYSYSRREATFTNCILEQKQYCFRPVVVAAMKIGH